MKPRISVITLGVDDLNTAVRFYRDGLHLRTQGIVGQEIEHGAVCFFNLNDNLLLAVWPRQSLAHDAQLPVTSPSPTDFTIGHNVRSIEEVDTVLAEAEAAGARIVKSGAHTPWGGYAGYFQDLDAHLWEIVWNPELLPED
jgi:catechol 2,3-dioxygenase-like lactoylglutathione lyase family enzyme